jgi:hypothetical protein
VGKLEIEWEKMSNKVRFILEVINGTLVVSNKKKDILMKELHDKKYKVITPDAGKVGTKKQALMEVLTRQMIWTFRMMKNISPILALRSASSYFVHF